MKMTFDETFGRPFVIFLTKKKIFYVYQTFSKQKYRVFACALALIKNQNNLIK